MPSGPFDPSRTDLQEDFAMSAHDRSDTRSPAAYRATGPATAQAHPSVHRTAGRDGAPPRVLAPTPAASGRRARHAGRAPLHIEGCTAGPAAEPCGARRPVPARYVDSDCLIGVRHPHRPGLLQARSVDAGGHPRIMLPVLRTLWAAAGGDSIRLAARLLAHDWHCLDPAIPTTAPTPATATNPAARGDRHRRRDRSGVTGRRVIAGVGITHAAAGEPVQLVPLAHLGLLDAAWWYLLDPVCDRVTVHTGDGGLVSYYTLAA
ncbi:hypothetical protein [Dactylosporangium matsuzakiense]|nr:hypothetical protein [Dactylosporangium matsuzakiense]